MDKNLKIGTIVVRTPDGKVRPAEAGDTGPMFVIADAFHLNGPSGESNWSVTYHCVSKDEAWNRSLIFDPGPSLAEISAPKARPEPRGLLSVEL